MWTDVDTGARCSVYCETCASCPFRIWIADAKNCSNQTFANYPCKGSMIATCGVGFRKAIESGISGNPVRAIVAAEGLKK